MALATRCPHCHALFRVVADQLKLRAGLVRCGACGHVFDAIGTLSYLDDASLRPATESTPTAESGTALTLRIPPEVPRTSQSENGRSTAEAIPPLPAADAVVAPTDREPAPDSTDALRSDSPPPVEDVATPVMETIKVTGATAADAPADASETPEPDQVGSEAESGREADESEPPVEAEFLRNADTRRKSAKIAYLAGALVLGVALALQFAVIYRADIAAQWPAARAGLQTVCKALGCRVGWPMRGQMLAVVGTELQSYPGTTALELTAVVRNRADSTLALPAIEVTLTDTQNRAVARKVLTPADYLPPREASARLAAGLEAGADLTIRIVFEAPDLNVAGFVVYPFYI